MIKRKRDKMLDKPRSLLFSSSRLIIKDPLSIGPKVNVLKFQSLFSICSKIKCWLFRIANREDHGQSASCLQFDLGMCCFT